MIKKYNIFFSSSKKSQELYNLFIKLIPSDFILDKKDFEYAFIIGGDGFFLNIVRYLNKQDLKIILINGGTFGFYSFFNSNNLNKIFDLITCQDFFININMLSIELNNKSYLSLNEILVSSDVLQTINVYIDNCFYEKYKGTGLLFSTQNGSSARARSSKGAVIFPSLEAYEMIEIEPILQKWNSTLISPIILSNKSQIDLLIKNYQNTFILIDGQEKITALCSNYIKIKSVKSKFKLFFNFDVKNYIKKLQQEFISGDNNEQ